MMAENDNSSQLPEKIGNVASIVFLIGLGALFLYGYMSHFV